MNRPVVIKEFGWLKYFPRRETLEPEFFTLDATQNFKDKHQSYRNSIQKNRKIGNMSHVIWYQLALISKPNKGH